MTTKILAKKDYKSITICLSLIALALFGLYYENLSYPFVFDSLIIRESHFDPYLHLENFTIFRARWLSYLTLGLIQKNFTDPVPIHKTVNLIFHALNSGLLFFFLRQLFFIVLKPATKKRVHLTSYAFVGAFFFAISPISVYAAAYVIQRNYLMAVFFCLIALMLYVHGLTHKKYKWIYATIPLYYLGLSSKEHVVMLPAVFLLITFLINRPQRPDFKPLFKKLVIPFICYALLALQTAALISHIIGEAYEPLSHKMVVVEDDSGTNTKVESAASQLKQSSKAPDHLYAVAAVNQGYMFFKYLSYWIFPLDSKISINISFPYPKSILSWPETLFFILFLVYPFIAWHFLKQSNEKSLLGFALLFPWLLFLTEFSVARFHEHFVLYRSYFWITGFFAALPYLFKRVPVSIQFLVVAILALYYADVTTKRLATFETKLKVWIDASSKIDYDKRNDYTLSIYRNFTNTAAYYSTDKQYDKAIEYYKKAVEIYPTHAMSLRALGHLQLKKGEHDLAFKNISKALEVNPEYATAHYNMGNYYSKLNQPRKAIESYHLAIKYQPIYSTAYYNLGNMYSQIHDYDNAIRYFSKSLKQNSRSRDTHYNLGNAYFRKGDYKRAVTSYRLSIKVDDSYVSAYHNLAVAYSKLGQIDKAIRELEKAVKLDPSYKQSATLLEKLKKSQKKP